MDLSNLTIRFGLPYFFDEQGKQALKNMMDKKVQMSTMPWNVLDVIRLTRVMSVQD